MDKLLTVILSLPALVILLGLLALQEDRYQERLNQKKKKEKEIEKIPASDLVNKSCNAEGHSRRKKELKDDYKTKTDGILSDFLGGADQTTRPPDAGGSRSTDRIKL